jgi:hypothetical protein
LELLELLELIWVELIWVAAGWEVRFTARAHDSKATDYWASIGELAGTSTADGGPFAVDWDVSLASQSDERNWRAGCGKSSAAGWKICAETAKGKRLKVAG